jgi:ABC-type dipeptide/oligopeptide/nickel transport system permease subunit
MVDWDKATVWVGVVCCLYSLLFTIYIGFIIGYCAIQFGIINQSLTRIEKEVKKNGRRK